MKARRYVLSVVLGLVAGLLEGTTLAASGKPELELSGLAVGPDGRVIAIVRGIGMVREGQVIPLSSATADYRAQIVNITADGVYYDILETIPKQKKAGDDEDKRKGKQDADKGDPAGLRDPFGPPRI
jgi:hypothetical protein